MPQGRSLKRDLFIEAYLGKAKGNLTKAAKLAGYAGGAKTLATQGQRMLRNAYVQAQVSGRVEAVGATTDDILKELMGIAFADVDETAETGMFLDAPSVQAKLKALELLGKYHAMFTDVVKGPDIPKDPKGLADLLRREHERVFGADPDAVH